MIRDIKVDDLSWEPHPILKDLLIKKLLTHEKDNIDLSIVMVKVKKGTEVPAHVHEQDDIVYHLEGKGKMWIEDEGDFDVMPGSFMRIPAGVKHQPHDIEEDILAFDIFFPHLF
ncbi:MAG: cupin domain-containing protein [Desulfobacteraceae bacterium]|nr:cupin domain-containing protein [Desulfobacteraceae bacterium]